MTDKAYAVPLHELLASVPREARLVIDDDDGMGTRFIPVGRYCNEAAEALRARLAQPEPYAAQAAMVAQQTQGRMYVDPVTGDVGIGTVKSLREWQGLTDEEINKIAATPAAIPGTYVHAFARAIEAKLREKNNG